MQEEQDGLRRIVRTEVDALRETAEGNHRFFVDHAGLPE
jgi:hypothetical protein